MCLLLNLHLSVARSYCSYLSHSFSLLVCEFHGFPRQGKAVSRPMSEKGRVFLVSGGVEVLGVTSLGSLGAVFSGVVGLGWSAPAV